MRKLMLAGSALTVLLTGCGSTNQLLSERHQTVEMYHIFDVKTTASTQAVAKAVSDGLARNTNRVDSAMPLQLGKPVPDQPGRFTIEDVGAMFTGNGSALMRLAASQAGGGVGLKAANCNGAVWTSKAVRDITGSNLLTLHTCVYKYKAGYHLNIYAMFQKQEGGVYELARQGAYKIAGTPEEWVNKTILDAVRSVERATGAKAVHVEGQPSLGDLPAVDKLDRMGG